MQTSVEFQQHGEEVSAGERFEFGKNWSRFLQHLNPARIRQAEISLREGLRLDSLAGLEFIDIGSGSGLFSLAARRLGARVTSLDYDPHSVACTQELRRRYFPDDPDWKVISGSALDLSFLESLGAFDVVYSWGVLHHTGQMWLGLENVSHLVKPHGRLFIAIYNDQGTPSRRWTSLKRFYNRHPSLRTPLAAACFAYLFWVPIVKATLKGDPLEPIRNYGKDRGMSAWHDVVDWIGGYPFEVATPQQIFEFYRDKGFQLDFMTTDRGSIGCNQFGFIR